MAECFAQYANQLWEERGGADLDKGFYRLMVEENKDGPAFWKVHLCDPGKGKELDSALYDRGSQMLHAPRRTVGDPAFFTTLRRWTKDNRYGNASWPRFEKLAAQVSGRDLCGFFHAWAHSSTVPPGKYLYPGSLGDLAAS